MPPSERAGVGAVNAPLPGSYAPDLIFSHRFHLGKARARCADCHARAEASTSAADNLLPLEKNCLACHDGRKARAGCTVCHRNAPGAEARRRDEGAPRAARPATPRNYRFSHRQHVALGDVGPLLAAAIAQGLYLSPARPRPRDLKKGNACGACHRGVGRTDLAGETNLPRMADCLVCHGEIDLPFSCEFCHTKGAALKPASHTPDYLERHSRGKLEKTGCAVCHGVKFRCMGCH